MSEHGSDNTDELLTGLDPLLAESNKLTDKSNSESKNIYLYRAQSVPKVNNVEQWMSENSNRSGPLTTAHLRTYSSQNDLTVAPDYTTTGYSVPGSVTKSTSGKMQNISSLPPVAPRHHEQPPVSDYIMASAPVNYGPSLHKTKLANGQSFEPRRHSAGGSVSSITSGGSAISVETIERVRRSLNTRLSNTEKNNISSVEPILTSTGKLHEERKLTANNAGYSRYCWLSGNTSSVPRSDEMSVRQQVNGSLGLQTNVSTVPSRATMTANSQVQSNTGVLIQQPTYAGSNSDALRQPPYTGPNSNVLRQQTPCTGPNSDALIQQPSYTGSNSDALRQQSTYTGPNSGALRQQSTYMGSTNALRQQPSYTGPNSDALRQQSIYTGPNSDALRQQPTYTGSTDALKQPSSTGSNSDTLRQQPPYAGPNSDALRHQIPADSVRDHHGVRQLPVVDESQNARQQSQNYLSGGTVPVRQSTASESPPVMQSTILRRSATNAPAAHQYYQQREAELINKFETEKQAHEQLEMKYQQVQSELNKLRSNLSRKDEILTEKEENHRKQEKTWNERALATEKRLTQAESLVRELQMAVKTAEARRSEASELVEKNEKKFAERERGMQKEMQELRSHCDKMESNVRKLERDVVNCERQKEELKQEHSLKVAQLDKQHRRVESDWEGRMEALKLELENSAQAKLQRAENDLREKHRADMQEMISRHKSELDKVRAEMDSELARAVDRQNSLQEDLRTAHSQVDLLRAQKRDAEVSRLEMLTRMQSVMKVHCDAALSVISAPEQVKPDLPAPPVIPDLSATPPPAPPSVLPPASLPAALHLDAIPEMNMGPHEDDTAADLSSCSSVSSQTTPVADEPPEHNSGLDFSYVEPVPESESCSCSSITDCSLSAPRDEPSSISFVRTILDNTSSPREQKSPSRRIRSRRPVSSTKSQQQDQAIQEVLAMKEYLEELQRSGVLPQKSRGSSATSTPTRRKKKRQSSSLLNNTTIDSRRNLWRV